jgi:hypothetical protein
VALEGDRVVFNIFPDRGLVPIPVEDSAQGARDAIAPFFDRRVSIACTQIREGGRPRALVHHVVSHDEIRRRAFEISESSESGTPEENGLRAELGLLPEAQA